MRYIIVKRTLSASWLNFSLLIYMYSSSWVRNPHNLDWVLLKGLGGLVLTEFACSCLSRLATVLCNWSIISSTWSGDGRGVHQVSLLFELVSILFDIVIFFKSLQDFTCTDWWLLCHNLHFLMPICTCSLVNLVVKGSYLNPNFCIIIIVVTLYTIWSVTLTDLPRCLSITAPAGAFMS